MSETLAPGIFTDASKATSHKQEMTVGNYEASLQSLICPESANVRAVSHSHSQETFA